MKIRNSNIELLRLVAMFFILAGHYMSYSGLIETTTGVNQVFAFLLGSGARISVSVFLIIGIWYMVDQQFRAERVIKLYAEIWFYGLLISSVFLVFKLPVSGYSVIRTIFPFFLRSTWFGTAYISLILISPFLNKILEINEKSLIILLIILAFITVPFVSLSGFTDTWLDVIFYFMYLYILVGYYKKYLHDKAVHAINRSLIGCGGVFLYLLLSIGKMICYNRQASSSLFYYGYKILNCWLIDYKQMPNLICAFCVFFFFITSKPKENRQINWLANGTFAIYIVHQVPPMESYLWTGIFRCGSWSDESWLIPCSILLLVVIMLTVTLIDHLRIKTVEAWLMKSNRIRSFVKRIEGLYKNVCKI